MANDAKREYHKAKNVYKKTENEKTQGISNQKWGKKQKQCKKKQFYSQIAKYNIKNQYRAFQTKITQYI